MFCYFFPAEIDSGTFREVVDFRSLLAIETKVVEIGENRSIQFTSACLSIQPILLAPSSFVRKARSPEHTHSTHPSASEKEIKRK